MPSPTGRSPATPPPSACSTADWPDDPWLQAVAAEMNLSETAFLCAGRRLARWLVHAEGRGGPVRPRHPGGAHVLWQTAPRRRRKRSASPRAAALLSATRRGGGIELDFPAKPAEPAEPPPGLLEAVGAHPRYVGRNQFDYLVEVKSASESCGRCRPDFRRLAAVDCRGVIVTAPSDDEQVRLRFPVLRPGRRHRRGPGDRLGPLLPGGLLGEGLGKAELVGYQASRAGRGGAGGSSRGPGQARRPGGHGGPRGVAQACRVGTAHRMGKTVGEWPDPTPRHRPVAAARSNRKTAAS